MQLWVFGKFHIIHCCTHQNLDHELKYMFLQSLLLWFFFYSSSISRAINYNLRIRKKIHVCIVWGGSSRSHNVRHWQPCLGYHMHQLVTSTLGGKYSYFLKHKNRWVETQPNSQLMAVEPESATRTHGSRASTDNEGHLCHFCKGLLHSIKV